MLIKAFASANPWGDQGRRGSLPRVMSQASLGSDRVSTIPRDSTLCLSCYHSGEQERGLLASTASPCQVWDRYIIMCVPVVSLFPSIHPFSEPCGHFLSLGLQ